MGRALFSQNYNTAPTTHVDSELDIRTYETWSKSNPFDPDSDEFFIDAEYEAFIDPAEYQRQQEERLRDDDEENRASIVMQIDTDSGVSLSSGSPLLSSRGSPMAVGSDDPAVILADAGYASPPEWDRPSVATSFEDWMRMGRIVMPNDTAGYIPPLSIEEDGGEQSASIPSDQGQRGNRVRSTSVSAIRDRYSDVPSSGQLNSRRTITITPIDVTPTEHRSRSPSPVTPGTPPRSRNNFQVQNLITPSPAPTVTPRIYSWHAAANPWITQSPTPRPTSPSAQMASSSPLTNPNARISRSRLTFETVRVRMQSAAI
ncbi:hypothetical protein AX17_001758 [Amanita inopinata Kibby_2008]|nr:hypothetical protein AX17_001758 [Amanita inopinata Kibby_2008]